jgi:protein phosphatase
MIFSVGAKTDPGKRANNEDCYVVAIGEDLSLSVEAILIVADGMGGRNFGEQASETASKVSIEVLRETLAASRGQEIPVQDAIGTALRKANAAVYELAQTSEDYEGMGTTCVIAVLTKDRLFMGHAGDSRGYMIRNASLERITDDHSFVAEQVRAGNITEEHARKSRFRNVITRAVGIEPTIEPDIVEFSLSGVDAVLLCTDGLSNEVFDPDLQRILLRANNAQDAANRLVDLANKRGGHDNITAVVAHFGTGPIAEGPDDDPEDAEFFRESGGGGGIKIGLMPILAFLLVVSLFIAVYFGQMLSAAGYAFKAAPPFVAKPSPPPPPPAIDYARLTYAKPAAVPGVPPVQDDALARNPKTGDLTMQTVSGGVLTIGPDGSERARFTIPNAAATAHTSDGGRHSEQDAPQGFAVDPAGDLYLTDQVHHSILQFDSSGNPIASIGHGLLARPTAVAVDDSGSIFVIDSNRLKVIRASSATP